MFRDLLTLALLCNGMSCSSVGYTGGSDVPSDNLLLVELALEDQEARRGGSPGRSDLDRLRLVIDEIGAGRMHTSDDRRNAALVLLQQFGEAPRRQAP